MALIGAVVLAVGVASLIGNAADYDKILDSLQGAQKQWFPVAFGALFLKYTGYVLAYREVARLDGGPRLPVFLTFKVVAAGFGAMIVATGAGALAVDYWALRRAGTGHDGAMARVLGLNTLKWAVLGSAATVCALALIARAGPDVPLGATLPWLLVVPLCFAAGAWISAPARSGRFTSPGQGKVRRLFADAIQGLVLLRRLSLLPVRQGGWGVLGIALFWAGDVICLWAALRAFDIQLGLPALILAYATGYAVTILPLPAGGAGGVEAAMTYALTLVGVPLVPALLGTVVYRVFTFWLPLLPAIAVLPFLRQIRAELPEARPARA